MPCVDYFHTLEVELESDGGQLQDHTYSAVGLLPLHIMCSHLTLKITPGIDQEIIH